MQGIYTYEVTAEDMTHAADMLRFDGAFEVQRKEDGRYRVRSLHHTPARWSSFCAKPVLMELVQVSEREWKEHARAAENFLAGIRFAQSVIGKATGTSMRLVEG